MESEIARKKEHLNVATNFQKARGWVRTNWKSKNHVPGAETEEEFLQLSSEEDEDDEARSYQSGRSRSPRQNASASPSKVMIHRPKIFDMSEDTEMYNVR